MAKKSLTPKQETMTEAEMQGVIVSGFNSVQSAVEDQTPILEAIRELLKKIEEHLARQA